MEREYKYDNIKFILIFLVVLAHIMYVLECSHYLYFFIFLFHMPAFVYISGYFSKGGKKGIIKPIVLYIIFQTIYFLIDLIIFKKNISLNYFEPSWTLWYLLSLGIWNITITIIDFKKIKKKYICYIIIVLLFFISIISGYFDKIGNFFSLARIINFYPYFMIGYFTKNNSIQIFNSKDYKNNKKIIKHIFILFGIISSVFFLHTKNPNRRWLYGLYSYNNAKYNITIRIMQILFSLFMIHLFNSIVPNKKVFISTIGSHTLYIYLIHGLIIKLFKQDIVDFKIEYNWFNIIISLILTIFLIIICEIIEMIIELIYNKIGNLKTKDKNINNKKRLLIKEKGENSNEELC